MQGLSRVLIYTLQTEDRSNTGSGYLTNSSASVHNSLSLCHYSAEAEACTYSYELTGWFNDLIYFIPTTSLA